MTCDHDEPPFSSEDQTYGCRDGLDSDPDLSVEVRDNGPGEASPGSGELSAMIYRFFCLGWIDVDSCVSLTPFTGSSRGVESSFAMDRETSTVAGFFFLFFFFFFWL